MIKIYKKTVFYINNNKSNSNNKYKNALKVIIIFFNCKIIILEIYIKRKRGRRSSRKST